MPDSLQIVKRFYPDVETIRDAKRPMTIQVTPRDTRALPKDHRHCALAMACQRLDGINGALISMRTVYLVRGTVATRYEVPERVSREIVAFDRGGHFAPGIYTLLRAQKRNPRGSYTGKGKPNRGQGRLRHRPTSNIRPSLLHYRP